MSKKKNIFRLKQTMTETETETLLNYIQKGSLPTQQEWGIILSTLHVQIALKCVRYAHHIESRCLRAVIKRQHQRLFQEVVRKITAIPPNIINVVMSVNSFYLYTCLNRGLDPNQVMANNQTPLEYACRNYCLQHIQVLLSSNKIIVHKNIFSFMLRKIRLRRFAGMAFKRCNDDVTPNMIVEILAANVSEALICVMEKLEEKYKGKQIWTEICFMLRCPISLEYSTDLVKTPSNHYFDKECLLVWVRNHQNNPLTREQLYESDLIDRNTFLPQLVNEINQKIKRLV
jgi:ankyrin repeat protein